ncbi:MAG: hypothetical protein A4E35_00833 [Methanoregula sp. PtaU1.Bin051]|nr:MAG: hypothetical protein A4E35_00833 [Methanoregula sp. PtaU1.Bin051]
MKTIVCLVSTQHVPNLLTVRAVNPGNLVLVVTEGMKKNVPWFLNALAAGGRDYSQNHEIIGVERENSVDEVLTSLNEAYRKRPGDEWIINVTGGTKPMSIGAYAFAKENGLKALYIVESDQNKAIDLSGGGPVALDHIVSTAEFLAGYGYDIRNGKDLDRQNRQAWELQGLGAMLTEQHEDPEIRAFLASLQRLKEAKKRESRRKWEKEGLILSGEEGLWIGNDPIRARICREFRLRGEDGALAGRLERHAAEFLTGRWLEYFIYGLLVPFVPESLTSLQIGLAAGQPGPGESNEFDVSFMANQSLCIVECKTGSQKQDVKGDAVLYKMEAIKAGLGAIRVRAFLATTSPNVIDPGTKDTREALKNRANLYQCSIIHGGTLKHLASLYLANDPSLHAKVAAVFGLKSRPGAS